MGSSTLTLCCARGVSNKPKYKNNLGFRYDQYDVAVVEIYFA